MTKLKEKKAHEQRFSDHVDLKDDGYDGQYQQQKGGYQNYTNKNNIKNQQYYQAKMFNNKGKNNNLNK